MSSATAPTNDPADRALQRDEDMRCCREMLHELAELGMGIARALHRHATAEPAAPENQPAAPAPERNPAPNPAIAVSAAFDCTARTVRRTIALARKLTEPDRAPAQGKQAVESAHQSAHQNEQYFHARRLAARKRIINAVEDTIQRHAEGADAEALLADLHERLDDPELDGDLEQLLLADVIAALCRDLGLAGLPDTHPWTPRAPQSLPQGVLEYVPGDVRDLCTRAAQPPREAALSPSSDSNLRQAPALTPHEPPRFTQPGTGPPSAPP